MGKEWILKRSQDRLHQSSFQYSIWWLIFGWWNQQNIRAISPHLDPRFSRGNEPRNVPRSYAIFHWLWGSGMNFKTRAQARNLSRGTWKTPLNMSIEKEEKNHLQKNQTKKHIFFWLVGGFFVCVIMPICFFGGC